MRTALVLVLIFATPLAFSEELDCEQRLVACVRGTEAFPDFCQLKFAHCTSSRAAVMEPLTPFFPNPPPEVSTSPLPQPEFPAAPLPQLARSPTFSESVAPSIEERNRQEDRKDLILMVALLQSGVFDVKTPEPPVVASPLAESTPSPDEDDGKKSKSHKNKE